jgi:hypothetical protein
VGQLFKLPPPFQAALFESRKCSILGMGLFGKITSPLPKPLMMSGKNKVSPVLSTKRAAHLSG